MKKLGITGGIGSGKTYICQLLKQRGIPVYHCDDEAKRLMVEDATIREKLTQLLGTEAYIGNQLNKPVIARYLFADSEHARQINGIVHPVVKQDFSQWANQQDAPIVVQECALLFETGFQDTVDDTIEVYAPQSIRLERAMRRDLASSEQILARMAQQMDEEEKRLRADHCIINDGIADLDVQIDRILQKIAEQNEKL